MEELLVVKIGGNVIDDEKALHTFLSDFASISTKKILVHGGGKLATELSTRLGIETKMVDGRRITGDETIRIVTMTYAGWVNKNITAILQAKDCNAIGLCGADAKLLPAVKRPVKDVDYGWVGDILSDEINVDFFETLLTGGITPVIAPVTADAKGHLLNVNADTIAQSIAESLSGDYHTTLIYCFEKNGLLYDIDDETTIIPEINFQDAEMLKGKGVITQGMIPKIDNAFSAHKSGVQNVVIGHAKFIKMMASKTKGYGTYIKA